MKHDIQNTLESLLASPWRVCMLLVGILFVGVVATGTSGVGETALPAPVLLTQMTCHEVAA